MIAPSAARGLAQHVIQSSLLSTRLGSQWRYQGFGMIQLYLRDGLRLHVWDRTVAVPGVSTIHDHIQWHFESLVLFGRLTNYRFEVLPGDHQTGEPYMEGHVQTGPSGHALDAGRPVRLWRGAPEVYVDGDTYSQRAREVHESVPHDGTVTIIQRDRTNEGDIARVYWPRGQSWVSAVPRPATPAEVVSACTKAIKLMEDK